MTSVLERWSHIGPVAMARANASLKKRNQRKLERESARCSNPNATESDDDDWFETECLARQDDVNSEERQAKEEMSTKYEEDQQDFGEGEGEEEEEEEEHEEQEESESECPSPDCTCHLKVEHVEYVIQMHGQGPEHGYLFTDEAGVRTR